MSDTSETVSLGKCCTHSKRYATFSIHFINFLQRLTFVEFVFHHNVRTWISIWMICSCPSWMGTLTSTRMLDLWSLPSRKATRSWRDLWLVLWIPSSLINDWMKTLELIKWIHWQHPFKVETKAWWITFIWVHLVKHHYSRWAATLKLHNNRWTWCQYHHFWCQDSLEVQTTIMPDSTSTKYHISISITTYHDDCKQLILIFFQQLHFWLTLCLRNWSSVRWTAFPVPEPGSSTSTRLPWSTNNKVRPCSLSLLPYW